MRRVRPLRRPLERAALLRKRLDRVRAGGGGVAVALPDEPAIVVLDEVPWLAEQDPISDGAVQHAWDRLLARLPVLLVLLGSDLHMMERLTAALEPAAADGALPFPDVRVVGDWWNRRFDPELDLVGADRGPVASRIPFVGSVKWLRSPFDRHDPAGLVRSAPAVPGYEPGRTGLVVVSLSGIGPAVAPDAVDLVRGPEDVVTAFR